VKLLLCLMATAAMFGQQPKTELFTVNGVIPAGSSSIIWHERPSIARAAAVASLADGFVLYDENGAIVLRLSLEKLGDPIHERLVDLLCQAGAKWPRDWSGWRDWVRKLNAPLKEAKK